MSHPHSLILTRPNKSMLQAHFSSPCNSEINIRRTDIRCSLWVMAQSGPEKPVRRSIVGSEQPREVSWGERRALGSDQSVARGCCAGSCLQEEAAGDRLQSVLSLFRGWDAIHQDFMLVDQPHDLVRAATGVEGICGLGPRGVRLAPRESLATHMATLGREAKDSLMC